MKKIFGTQSLKLKIISVRLMLRLVFIAKEKIWGSAVRDAAAPKLQINSTGGALDTSNGTGVIKRSPKMYGSFCQYGLVFHYKAEYFANYSLYKIVAFSRPSDQDTFTHQQCRFDGLVCQWSRALQAEKNHQNVRRNEQVQKLIWQMAGFFPYWIF